MCSYSCFLTEQMAAPNRCTSPSLSTFCYPQNRPTVVNLAYEVPSELSPPLQPHLMGPQLLEGFFLLQGLRSFSCGIPSTWDACALPANIPTVPLGPHFPSDLTFHVTSSEKPLFTHPNLSRNPLDTPTYMCLYGSEHPGLPSGLGAPRGKEPIQLAHNDLPHNCSRSSAGVQA